MSETARITTGPLVAADKAPWERLWFDYLAESRRTLAHEVTETTWRRLLGDDPVHGLAARDKGALVGFALLVVHPTTWDIRPRCYLNDLFTAAAARRRGVGRALIEATFAWAERRGCDRVYWLTHQDNAAAQTLYRALAERSGFIEYRHKLG